MVEESKPVELPEELIEHTQDFEKIVLPAELKKIGAGKDDLKGLALSGGGIRSASFCLGVIQGLGKEKMACFDYLSTVSGGGYIGSTLTWFRHNHEKGLQDKSASESAKESEALGRSMDALGLFADFLRVRGNYLNPSSRMSMMSAVGVVLRVGATTFTVYGGLILMLMLLLLLPFGNGGSLLGGNGTPIVFAAAKPDGIPFVFVDNYVLRLAGWLGVSFVFLSLFYSMCTTLGGVGFASGAYWFRRKWQEWAGHFLAMALSLAVIGILPTISGNLYAQGHGSLLSGLIIVAGGVMGLMGGKAATSRGLSGNGSSSFWDSGAAMNLYAVGALLAVLLAAYLGAGALLPLTYHPLQLLAAITVALLVLGWLNDINLVSLNRMYRDRLMEAFLPDPERLERSGWVKAAKANTANLSDMTGRPYHILNTNMVLVDSLQAKARGRGGDRFILSPLYCGSLTTGWTRTTRLLGGETWDRTEQRFRNDDGLSLATAMAISGAAVNAQSGCNGQGLTRSRAVSFLMGLFGLQLGFWVPGRRRPWCSRPNILHPGMRTLLGTGFRGYSDFNLLTDGGHFENLGVYELIRRKVKTIVAVDAGADPEYQFGDLATLVERCYADFGVSITFPGGLAALMPQDPLPVGFDHSPRVAKTAVIIGDITYQGGAPGKLIYVKSVLVADLPANVLSYAAEQKAFPNQSTLDQFFDENQLEAYRRLGEEISSGIKLA